MAKAPDRFDVDLKLTETRLGELVVAVMDAPKNNFVHAKIVISHATEDYPTAESLADALVHESLKAWLAKRDVPIGSNWPEEITRAISSADFLVVLLSPESIASPHVRREVNMAISKGVTLLPVLLDSHANVLETLPDDWNYWLSVVQIVNFTDARTTASQIAQQVKQRMPLAVRQTNVQISPLSSKKIAPEPTQPTTNKQKAPLPQQEARKFENGSSVISQKAFPELQKHKARVNLPIFAGVIAGIVVLLAIFLILTNGSKKASLTAAQNSTTASEKNVNKKSETPKVLTKASAQTVSPTKSSLTSPSPTKSASATPSPTKTASATPSPTKTASATPSPTKTASATSSPTSSLTVTSSILKQLAIAAGRNLLDCVQKIGIAPTGCPFREKTWVQASEVTWALKGSPHVTSATKVGARYSATVAFTVVDKASYGTIVSHTRTQNISRPAIFTRSGGSYIVSWK